MKSRTKILLIVSVIVIIAIAYKNCSPENKKSANSQDEVLKNNTLQINPPLPNINISYDYFNISAEKDTIITTNSGTVIRIPKNAFLDESGNIVSGNVKIEYRELRNPLDFYITGVPMEINESGEDKVFISGGMVEFNAYNSESENLKVNPENKIKLDLLSDTKSTDFNLYDLDQKTNQWVLKGKDVINVRTKNDEIEALNIPRRPEVAKPYSFSIKDDTNQFPEIREYENVKFTPIDLSKCKISDAQEMQVIPKKNGVFEVVSILKYGSFKKENSCLCYLSFNEGKDYNKALKIYQTKYADLIKERDRIIKEWAEYELYLGKSKILKADLNEKITRTLEINQFGFVNLDYPTSYPIGVELIANFKDASGNKLILKNIVLIEKGTNAIYRYDKTIKFNPNKENILYGITPDNKIAYIKKDDLANYDNNSKSVIMKIYDGKLSTYDDVYNLLFK